MMFLLRVAFCLTLVALFLPTSSAESEPGETQINPAQAFGAASAAFADMRQFCVRQADACSVGSQAAAVVGQKAQAAAKLAYEFLSAQIGADGHPAAHGKGEATAAVNSEKARNTLTEADRALPWRGQPARPALLARHST